MKIPQNKTLLELNLGLLFISTSGVMGRYISMSPPVTVWWRCALGMVFLWMYCRWSGVSLKVILKRDRLVIFISSFLLVAHWITYFYALHWSNVAIAFITLYTFPAMTTLLEPLLLKTGFNKFHLLLGVLVLVGVYVMMPDIDLGNSNFLGMMIGLVSALCFAMRNIYSRDLAQQYDGSHLMWVQLVIGTVLLVPVLFMFENNDFTSQWEALLFLGIVTTALGHTLFLRSFKYFSISTASLLASIIPIYGILLALIFLGEVPSFRTIIGGALVLSTVVIESFRVRIK
ncbi:MAG: DMT family transporter [Saprospiraceae bacterium]